MKEPRKPTDFAHQHPKDERAYGERLEDPYQARGKYSEPTVCTGCGAVFHKGRWHWGSPIAGAHQQLCPACQRIHDDQPAGILTISGEFFPAHREEILNLIDNYEEKEKPEHPLQRVMGVTDEDGGTIVTFTDMHLARGVGEALHRAYEGELDFEYNEKATVFRVNWSR